MTKIASYLVMIIIMISLVNAISVDDFNLAKDYSNSNNCSITIQMLEKGCSNFSYDDYKEAQCNFILGFCYYELFDNLTLMSIEHENKTYYLSYNDNFLLLNKSTYHYEKTINLSMSKLTNKALLKNNRSFFLIRSSLLVSNNYLILDEYEKASKTIKIAETILDLAYQYYPGENEERTLLKKIIKKLYSAIPSKVEVELKGDLSPIFYSQPEIKPEIILESKEDPNFKLLHIEYQNLNGFNQKDIQSVNSQFILNNKLSLYKKNSLFFPFDSFYSEIYNINPSRIQNKNIQISIIGESSNIEGMAQFEKDKIKLKFNRKLSYSIQILLSFLLLLTGLIFFNKKIKYMKKTSFQPSNLIKDWSFDLSLFSLIFFITKDHENIFNLLSSIILIIIFITIFRFYKKKKKSFLTLISVLYVPSPNFNTRIIHLCKQTLINLNPIPPSMNQHQKWQKEVREVYEKMKSHKEIYTIDVDGVKLDIFPNVFSPAYITDSIWFANVVKEIVGQGSLLDIGTGTGGHALLPEIQKLSSKYNKELILLDKINMPITHGSHIKNDYRIYELI